MIKFHPPLGRDIRYACDKAAALASQSNETVSFRFNGIDVVVTPGEPAEAPANRWWDEANRRMEAYRNRLTGFHAATTIQGIP